MHVSYYPCTGWWLLIHDMCLLQLFAVIARQPSINVDRAGSILSEVRGDIELENVVFCYPARPDRRIFDGFSLTIPAGNVLVIVPLTYSRQIESVARANRCHCSFGW